jgi:hypothetical protein
LGRFSHCDHEQQRAVHSHINCPIVVRHVYGDGVLRREFKCGSRDGLLAFGGLIIAFRIAYDRAS